MSARKRLGQAASNRALAANADLFDGSPWSLEAAKRERAVRLRVVYPTDFQDVLSVAEDLWMRVGRNAGLHLHVEGQSALHIGTHAGDDESVQELLAAVRTKIATGWSQSEDGEENSKRRPLCLAQDISWRTDTLVIELITQERLDRHVGEDGVWQFQALLARILAIAQPVVLSGGSVPVDQEPCMAHQEVDCSQGTALQMVPSLGPDYWQQQMCVIKRSMDAGGI